MYVTNQKEKITKATKINPTTFTTTGRTLGRLLGKSNPLRASSANAKQPPCHEPSPCKTMVF